MTVCFPPFCCCIYTYDDILGLTSVFLLSEHKTRQKAGVSDASYSLIHHSNFWWIPKLTMIIFTSIKSYFRPLSFNKIPNVMFEQHSPYFLRARLIKAKSNLPTINCYLWGAFFTKLGATFKCTLTLAIGHNTVMHSHLWQILCKRTANRIFDQVFPDQGHMVGAFSSIRLTLHTVSITWLYRIHAVKHKHQMLEYSVNCTVAWQVLGCQWHPAWRMEVQLWSTPEGGTSEMRGCGL